MKKLTITFLSILVLINSVFSEDMYRDLYDTIIPVDMYNDFNIKSVSNVHINLRINALNDKLVLDLETAEFDKRYWNNSTWKEVDHDQNYYNKFINLNHGAMRVFLLTPQNIQILNTKQYAYYIPNYEYEEILPIENNIEAQIILKVGEKLVDWAIGETGIPFANKLYDNFIQYSQKKSQQEYKALFENINRTYNPNKISSNPRTRIDCLETASRYEFSIDLSKINIGEEVPICFWVKLALGSPFGANDGSSPNKYGESNGFTVNISLKRDIPSILLEN